MSEKPRGRKKRRTREHVIADLSVNFVERMIFLEGHSSEKIIHDYGIDLIMFTYDKNGEIENGHVGIQVKATDNLRIRKSGTISFAVEVTDLFYWYEDPLPIILVIYDAATTEGKAYWLYIQSYLKEPSIKEKLNKIDRDSLTVHVPSKNQLNGEAIEQFRRFRDRVLAQVNGVIDHDS